MTALPWTIKELKENAKVLLKKRYAKSAKVVFTVLGPSFVLGLLLSIPITILCFIDVFTGVDITHAFLLYILLCYLASIILRILYIFLINVLYVGAIRFFLNFRSGREQYDDIKLGFRDGNYWHFVKVMFLVRLYTFLWGLLLWVPGIIKRYEYKMVPFLLAENPKISAKEAFVRSKQMMDGQKSNAFLMSLSFIGWYYLSTKTYQILMFFYLGPYYMLTFSELYNKLKGENLQSLGYLLNSYSKTGPMYYGQNNASYYAAPPVTTQTPGVPQYYPGQTPINKNDNTNNPIY